ncbi:hypothetical protein MYCTH_2294348 [Thermothelomyces thermophilus ATCC 42464]|uniref:Uncharacterized protein n=1 Tax=Thermothelomyces thermophilus (strain ATCC 42464 / BCRC 31852 / DSM 1799) TaxID=573729 RepID=G2Q0W0_THET4|nr:uncharacterized protein MYCTH_2294348 [Thermothelomyces thermophilus ATCC 42464]AEO53260.1 hypothetical protein MYCTH_2294348 [Thermothelomyces thermophilus ATCC 42464]
MAPSTKPGPTDLKASESAPHAFLNCSRKAEDETDRVTSLQQGLRLHQKDINTTKISTSTRPSTLPFTPYHRKTRQ